MNNYASLKYASPVFLPVDSVHDMEKILGHFELLKIMKNICPINHQVHCEFTSIFKKI